MSICYLSECFVIHVITCSAFVISNSAFVVTDSAVPVPLVFLCSSRGQHIVTALSVLPSVHSLNFVRAKSQQLRFYVQFVTIHTRLSLHSEIKADIKI